MVDVGGHSEGVTPVPIPNTEVKSLCDSGSTALRRGTRDAATLLLSHSTPVLDMNLHRLLNNARLFGLLTVLTGLFIGAGYIIGGTTGMLIGLVFAGIGNFASYWFSDSIVRKMYGARRPEGDEKKKIEGIVERLAEDQGLPVPDVYVAEMGVPNAFATRRNPSNASIVVTHQLLSELNSDEVEGVLAHELAHVKNRDTLINSVVATFAGAIAVMAEMVFWGSLFSGREEEGEMLSSLALMILTPLIASLIKAAISRKMEYRADTDAVEMAGPQGLSSALQKISQASERRKARHNSKVQEAGANLFIYNPFSADRLSKYFSTHPPLEDRLNNIQVSA